MIEARDVLTAVREEWLCTASIRNHLPGLTYRNDGTILNRLSALKMSGAVESRHDGQRFYWRLKT